MAVTNATTVEIDRYEVVTRLAKGGMGELFLARERGIGGFDRLVAIKRILPRLAEEGEIREMFLREARILARLNHPNVVQTIELGEDDAGNYYLVLEYIRGTTLRELQILAAEAGRRFPLDIAIGVVVQGLRGLHAAHELTDIHGARIGLVHRDVSPHNLMCTPEGNVKLFDFGVAKATIRDELTYSGNLKGKFPYMAPEQCARDALDHRADIFSMGIVLWELIAGERLFKRESELATMTAITNGDVPSLSDYRETLPYGLKDIVRRGLAVERDERWQSAQGFEQALSKCAAHADLDITPKRIAEFVSEVAGERLAARMRSLAAALERSLTEGERREIAHEDDAGTTIVDETSAKETFEMRPLAKRIEGREAAQPGGEPAMDDTDGRPRWVGWVAAVVIVGFVGGLVALSFDPMPSGPPLTVAWAPTIEPQALMKELEPVRAYLQRELDRPVRLAVPSTYDATARTIVYGRADIAALPPYAYVKTKQEHPDIVPLVSKVFDGSTGTDGLIVVPFESDVRNLEDLTGATFCFSDESSTTGYILPRAFIRAAGYDPDDFVGDVRWSGDHLSVIQDVLAGKCAAGATNSGTVMTAGEAGVESARIRRLAITGSIPHGTLTAGPHVPSRTRDAVTQALLRFDPREATGRRAVGETQRITAFRRPDEEAYRDLERALRAGE